MPYGDPLTGREDDYLPLPQISRLQSWKMNFRRRRKAHPTISTVLIAYLAAFVVIYVSALAGIVVFRATAMVMCMITIGMIVIYDHLSSSRNGRIDMPLKWGIVCLALLCMLGIIVIVAY